ncbi:MAG TPA: tetraacyldisaccharide 4'-kinase, partial [Candidatus Deferrimicrobiaceae bacterium]
MAARLRRALYDRGILKGETLPRPVISIGNLSVGGSGKTPHVRFIADWLSREGYRAAILSRGYGRSTRGV